MAGGRAPIAEASQSGWVSVAERNRGGGASAPEPSQGGAALAPDFSQGGRALVVERTRFMREKLVSLLGRAGWQVVGTAREGRPALELARRHCPDLVVLDLVLPDMQGTDLITAIKSELPGCRVVVCSALVQSRWVKAAVEAGADDFVVKPVDDTRFLAATGGDPARLPASQRQVLDEGG